MRVLLKDRSATLEVPGRGVYKGEVDVERYKALIKVYPQLDDQFEVIEETEPNSEVVKTSKK